MSYLAVDGRTVDKFKNGEEKMDMPSPLHVFDYIHILLIKGIMV